MQIASTGVSLTLPAAATARPPEAVEHGTDRDSDGDDPGGSAVRTLPAPPPGRGGTVDILA